jgi:hypothetical protein
MRARDNPFAVERIEAVRYRPLHTTGADLLLRLGVMNYRAALVGPEGSGKTTLLEDLQRALTKKGRRTRLVFVNDTRPLSGPRRRQLLADVDPDEVVFFDGADALPRSVWLWVKRRLLHEAAGLVITAHQPGLLPTLLDCYTTPQLLRQIVDTLQPRHRPVPPELLDDLYHHHHGNIRDCLRDLYDLFASDRMVGTCGPTARPR